MQEEFHPSQLGLQERQGISGGCENVSNSVVAEVGEPQVVSIKPDCGMEVNIEHQQSEESKQIGCITCLLSVRKIPVRVFSRGFVGGSALSVEYSISTISHMVFCISS